MVFGVEVDVEAAAIPSTDGAWFKGVVGLSGKASYLYYCKGVEDLVSLGALPLD